ncbi:MAG: T9SS type A sorting domain-containing protein, partial [Bacteroidota bacterium]
SYLWNTGATTANISATSAGTYSVTVTAANGCTSTASVGIGVNTTAPTASITNNTGTSSITCLVPTISLTASGNGSFLWSTGATTANISVTTGGTYAVTVTGSNGCTTTASVVINSNNSAPIAGITNNTGSNTLTCSISSISLTATGGGTYLWSTGATTANISVNAAGTYTVTVTGANGCSASSSIVINTNTSAPQAFIYASGSTTFCQGGSVTLTASSAGTGGSYLWSNGATTQAISATTSGSFVVTVTYSNGCKSTSAAATVTATPFVNTSVTITSNAPATTTATTSITFTATPVGGGQSPIYQWKKNGVNVGTNSAIYTNNAWVNGDVVNVVMTSSAPCANGSPATSNSITINVSGPVAKYLVVDITANRAYYYTSTWTFITSNPLSTTILNGVTNAEDVVSTGGAVYVLDGTNKTVYRSTAANTASTQSKTLRTNTGQALGNLVKGMAIKGDSLYIADQSKKSVFRYSLSAMFTGAGTTVNAAQVIALPTAASNLEAIAIDNTSLYVLNNGTTKNFYRYTLAGSANGTSRPLRTNTGAALSKVTGAVLDGNTMWVTDNGLDRSLSYDLSQLFLGTTNINATTINVLNSGNLNSTGITIVSNTTTIRLAEEGTMPAIQTTDAEQTLSVKAYPNPTSGLFNVLVDGLNSNEPCEIRVVDMTGRVTAQRTIEQGVNTTEPTFDLSGFKPGLYMIVIDQSDVRQTVRIVLQ